jgi:hypothetical protein
VYLATPFNSPICSPLGAVFLGTNQYFKIDSWQWGGISTSFEIFAAYATFNTNSRLFDFGSGAGSDNVFLGN